jgi:histidyl-tRNA synthetase
MARHNDPVFRAPKGVHDVLPDASGAWESVIRRFADRAGRFGYGLIISPMFEHVEVFRRVGEHTDVVSKEMYEFEDKGGRPLALRPEGTASVVRAYVERRVKEPWKVWYVAPNFRYERAQKGRYRQHWQLGAEVLGIDDPAVDVEVIAFLDGFYGELGLSGVTLALNSMGDAESRPAYVAALREYLLDHELGPEFRERVEANPMRMLDTKVPEWQEVVERAPQLTEHLSNASRSHFEDVQEGLQALGIKYELAPRLVRGFDYYTSTTFEFQSDALDAAQNALGGGGRYDGLAEQMGGSPTPGIGFGAGIERLMLALQAANVVPTARRLDAFFVNGLGGHGTLKTTVLVNELRAEGLSVDRTFGDRSVSAQLKSASRSGARFGVLLGMPEAADDELVVRDLDSGKQERVSEVALATWLSDRRGSGPVAP